MLEGSTAYLLLVSAHTLSLNNVKHFYWPVAETEINAYRVLCICVSIRDTNFSRLVPRSCI